MVIYGTRPEAIKMAPIVARIDQSSGLSSTVVVTGQHRHMLDQVNDLFGIEAAHDLDVNPAPADARTDHAAGRCSPGADWRARSAWAPGEESPTERSVDDSSLPECERSVQAIEHYFGLAHAPEEFDPIVGSCSGALAPCASGVVNNLAGEQAPVHRAELVVVDE
jgi:hypothetical protein